MRLERDKVCLIVLALIIGTLAYHYSQTGEVLPTPFNNNTSTDTTTTQTGTETTQTTTTPISTRYKFKAMWDYQPKMQISKPTYLSVGVMADDDLGEVYSELLVFDENTWYVKSDGYTFTEGVTYRLIISDSSQLYETIDGSPYKSITAGPVSYQWNLLAMGDDWGDLFFEWVVV